jgi:hypothetical protein
MFKTSRRCRACSVCILPRKYEAMPGTASAPMTTILSADCAALSWTGYFRTLAGVGTLGWEIHAKRIHAWQ